MSKKSTAPNSKKAAKQYVTWLASLEAVDKIYLSGSRSPLRDKKPGKHSDWDLVVETSVEKLKLVSPRTGSKLHADLLVLRTGQARTLNKVVEIYPNDTQKIFKGVKL